MKRAFKYIVFALIAIVVLGTFAFLFVKSKPEVDTYNELTATIGTVARTTVITGRIIPRNEVNIKPQINGIIAEIFKEAGQEVQKNEIIARLKVIPDMVSLSSAQSRLRLSELNLKQALVNYEREKALYDKDLVSAEEYDNVLQILNQAREEAAAAKESLEVIRDGVSSSNTTGSTTLVRSTISGLILDIPVKVGNSVIQANTMNEGTTVATVANMKDLIFDGNIDETEVGSLKEGSKMIITIGALHNYSLDATLEYISPKAVVNNGTNQFEIKAAVDVPDDRMIRSGYGANAELVLEKAENVILLQESALEFQGNDTFVYLKTGENEYSRTPVTTGLSDGINIEICSGLKEGDVVRGSKIIKENR